MNRSRFLLCAATCNAILLLSPTLFAQAQMPMPDPIGSGTTSASSTSTGSGSGAGDCQCEYKMVSMEDIASIETNFLVASSPTHLAPAGHTGQPTNECSGNDALYRQANGGVSRGYNTATFFVTTTQGFTIYNNTFGTDPGFPATHVHPSASVNGLLEWKVDG